MGDRRGRGGSIREAERLKRPGACGHVWAESTGHAKRTIHCSTQQKRKDGNRKVWGEFSFIGRLGWFCMVRECFFFSFLHNVQDLKMVFFYILIYFSKIISEAVEIIYIKIISDLMRAG